MSDERTTPEQVTKDTPASADPAPAKKEGDALLDGSGSRQGVPPEESREDVQQG
jgi:hypothetical protein